MNTTDEATRDAIEHIEEETRHIDDKLCNLISYEETSVDPNFNGGKELHRLLTLASVAITNVLNHAYEIKPRVSEVS